MVGLRFENRFSIDEDTAKFVSNLLKYATKHKTIKFDDGHEFHRARLHDPNATEQFSVEEMGAPPRDKAGHGRLNPSGIPYLYLSSDSLTAISEVRPWIGANLTVATFELTSDIEVINFSMKYKVNVPKDPDLDAAETTWRELITWMYSAPFDPRDDTSYVPTQFLAEQIKGAGFAGLVYDSPLNEEGFNLALFDTKMAKCSSTHKARVTALEVTADVREASKS